MNWISKNIYKNFTESSRATNPHTKQYHNAMLLGLNLDCMKNDTCHQTFSGDRAESDEVDGPNTEVFKRRLLRFQHNAIKQWFELLKGWVDYYKEKNTEKGKNSELKKNVTIVCYENLKKNTIKELTQISDFLNLRPSERRGNCMEKNNLEGSFHRKTISNGAKLVDLTNDQLLFKELNGEKFKDYLSQAYEILDDEGFDDAKQCVGNYLKRLDDIPLETQ